MWTTEARMATMVEKFNHLLRVQVDLNLSCVDNLEARMATIAENFNHLLHVQVCLNLSCVDNQVKVI